MLQTKISLDKVLLDMYSTFGIDQDNDKLLEKLLKAVVDYTNCDGGTLYLKKQDEHGNDCLDFKIILTKSMGIFMNFSADTPKPESLLPVAMRREFVSAYCAMEKRTVNIPDVYKCQDTELNFTGVKTYDSYNGYKTVSLLNFPIENDFGEVIAVVQLINCKEDDKIVPFPMHYNDVLESFGSQVGIVLRNNEFARKNKEQLYSFVEVLTTAVDEMSQFNANHTNNMAKIAENFLDWLVKEDKPLHFTQNQREQLIMSIRLHDIGKITTPSDILNKEKRLDAGFQILVGRIEKMKMSYEIAYYKGKMEQELSDEKMAELDDILDFLFKINSKGKLSPEEHEHLRSLKNAEFRSVNGRDEALFTVSEYESLSATNGNLSPEQRVKMEEHAVMTEKFLERIKFSNTFKDVVFWASSHHELLNGKGYPKGLKAEEIPKAVRLITIIDSYEAMTATDRPYKKKNPISPEKGLSILRKRVEDGELDGEILELFAESLGLK